jgi:hypothetical protein
MSDCVQTNLVDIGPKNNFIPHREREREAKWKRGPEYTLQSRRIEKLAKVALEAEFARTHHH